MASAAVITAVEARLAANWTHTPIYLPNDVAGVPIDGSAFMVLEFPFASEEQISLGTPGSRAFREEGSFLVTLCIQIGTGLNPTATPWATWIDALRSVFRGVQFSGVNTWAPSPPFVNDQSDRGAYLEMSFAVPYYFDITG